MTCPGAEARDPHTRAAVSASSRSDHQATENPGGDPAVAKWVGSGRGTEKDGQGPK